MVLRTRGPPAFFCSTVRATSKIKIQLFRRLCSARVQADSNEFFAHASPQFALSPRVKPVRSAQRTVAELHPDRDLPLIDPEPRSRIKLTAAGRNRRRMKERTSGGKENPRGRERERSELLPNERKLPRRPVIVSVREDSYISSVTNVLSLQHFRPRSSRNKSRIIFSKSLSRTGLTRPDQIGNDRILTIEI